MKFDEGTRVEFIRFNDRFGDPIFEAGVVVGEGDRDSVYVLPDEQPEGPPITLPKVSLCLADVEILPSNDLNGIYIQDVTPAENDEKVREIHGSGRVTAFWVERGIDPKVKAARPYDYWTKGNLDPLRDAFAGLAFELKPGQLNWLLSKAGQTHGVIIKRHPPPPVPGGQEYKPIYPEIRPDEKVETRPSTKHYHGSKPYHEAHPEGRLPNRFVHDPRNVKDHINKKHDGVSVEGEHYHPHAAKYLFPPSPKEIKKYWQAHKDMKPENVEGHIHKYHKGDSGRDLEWYWENSHVHEYSEKAIGADFASRVDVHPWAVELIKEHDRVFFGIEGCLKADAILSHGGAVFSVPSVSLWEAPELSRFIEEYLQGKEMIIVPDGDWFTNPAVIQQARFCQSYFKCHGVPARVAAPPHDCGHKGVDDFLGAGFALDDLDVIERELDTAKIRRTVEYKTRAVNGGRAKKPRIDRNAHVFENIVIHAAYRPGTEDDGVLAAPLKTVSRVVGGWGTGKRRPGITQVKQAIEDLAKAGLLTVEVGGAAIPAEEIPKSGCFLKVRENYFSHQYEWVDKPVFRVTQPFRGTQIHQRLGDL